MTRILNKITGITILSLCLFMLNASLQPNTSHAACSNPAGVAADIVYNSSAKIFQYCDDSNWIRMNEIPGSGSGSCNLGGAGTIPEGTLFYNQDYRVLSGCAGNVSSEIGIIGGANGWAQVVAGNNMSCGIKSDATLWCWGDDTGGKTGQNKASGSTTVPTQVYGGGSWSSVSVGYEHTCGIKTDSTLWCWGSNGNGRTGRNTIAGNTVVPTQISIGGTWKQVAVGFSSTCAIKTDNTLWCWGENLYGRTAINTGSGDTLVPTQVSGGGSWKSITIGYFHGCGIMSDNTVRCWGGNGSGQIGDNSTLMRLTPTAISGGGTWKFIDAGNGHTCGIKTNDTLWCWGWNSSGQIGDNSTTQRNTPTAVSGGGSWKQVSLGSYYSANHTCGIKSDNSLMCWGWNGTGKLGDNSTSNKLIPTIVTGGKLWSSVSTGGYYHTCGIDTQKILSCWGENTYYSILGIESDIKNYKVPIQVSGNDSWTDIAVAGLYGEQFSCGIKTGGSLWCWGWNMGYLGNLLGIGATEQTQPTLVTGGGTWNNIDAGHYSLCGIKSEGSLWCWGTNYYGNIGDSTFNDRNTPTQIIEPGPWKDLSISGYYGDETVCAIKQDGSLWCWGYNGEGQLGNGTTTESESPVQISGGGIWKQVSVGKTHTCAIKFDNTLWCWGENYATFGDGTYNDSLVPTNTTGSTEWLTISAGLWFTCGVRADNKLLCWGSNDTGRTGVGLTSGETLTPTEVLGGGSWRHVVTSANSDYNAFACGIKIDGSGWCWGSNNSGQLGDDTYTARSSPTQISGLGATSWSTIDTSYSHACGIYTGGKAVCWGSNTNGEIGDGTTANPNYIMFSAPISLAGCINPKGKTGDVVYNSDLNILQYCDGVGWVGIGK